MQLSAHEGLGKGGDVALLGQVHPLYILAVLLQRSCLQACLDGGRHWLLPSGAGHDVVAPDSAQDPAETVERRAALTPEVCSME